MMVTAEQQTKTRCLRTKKITIEEIFENEYTVDVNHGEYAIKDTLGNIIETGIA